MSVSSEDTSPLKGPAPKAQPEDTSDVDKPEDSMPLTGTSPGDRPVQFTPAQPANGDAKVEIGDSGTAPVFVGLGKEELMKYANDPFWVRLRWFLFILFWVLWVAMLAGAIVIIVLAPKCAEKKSHPEAYYELNVKNFAKDGKLADLGERAKYLADLGMTTVIISDVLKKDEGGTVDFKEVDESYGTTTDFAGAVKKLKSEGLRVLLQLTPNHFGLKHQWFADKPDFYIQKPADEVDGSNWKTADGAASAWATDTNNNSVKYLSQFSGNVDLDYRNDNVITEMKSILSLWKGKGVDGFMISAASYLVEDLERLDDPKATMNNPENLEVLKKILNRIPSDPHSIVEVKGLSPSDVEKYEENGLVPLSSSANINDAIDQYATASQIAGFFKRVHEKRGIIRLSGPKNRLQGQSQPEYANIIRLLAYTSNSSVITYFGDEAAGFDATKNEIDWEKSEAGETYKFLKALAGVQQNFVEEKGSEKFEDKAAEANNKDVIAIVRSDRYIILANIGTSEAIVDFSKFFGDGDIETEVVIFTPNAAEALQEKTLRKNTVTLPIRSGVLLERMMSEE